jgi:hypothetical protein
MPASGTPAGPSTVPARAPALAAVRAVVVAASAAAAAAAVGGVEDLVADVAARCAGGVLAATARPADAPMAADAVAAGSQAVRALAAIVQIAMRRVPRLIVLTAGE